METKTYEAMWEEFDGEYWYAEDGEVQANDTQEAIRLIVANLLTGREIIEIRGLLVREKETK